ncbi:hypothetical protein AC578_8058 [Pseudocercospora eumusae]|uniref:Cytochrome P450 n=1 Tax=Pseudocercospora eumusae TaxID=321146 RepID=A0A139H7M5_9PEZI|nr:hypothetical protein AC578_8058 [Pseudocercospora eumusae]
MIANIIYSIILLTTVRILYEYTIRDRKLPPGPRRLPLIGNLHQVPAAGQLPWLVYHKWAKQYGPIYSLQFGGTTFIVISSAEIARDLLDRRGSKYSDRLESVMAGEILTKGNHILLRPYDETYKLHQKMEAPVLNSRTSPLYAPVHELESLQLLNDLLTTADSHTFAQHLERYSISIIYSLTYGLRVPDFSHPDVATIHETQTHMLDCLVPGKWLVEVIPAMKHLPRCLAPWRVMAENYHKIESALHLKHMDHGLSSSRSWNWTKEFTSSPQGHEMEKLEMAYDLGILADAGMDTTAATLQTFVFAAVTQPAFLAPAQAELDAVIGHHRLPMLADKVRLPYIMAIVNETLRWHTVVPVLTPHATKVEDEYLGFRIPANSCVLALHWSMNMDETIFPDAHVFAPERWVVDADEGKKKKYHAFGYGRRICTGRHIAENSAFLVIARLLWAYDILSEGGEGMYREKLGAFVPSFVSKPLPFEARFVVRSEGKRELIERVWDVQEKDIDVVMGGVEGVWRKQQGGKA